MITPQRPTHGTQDAPPRDPTVRPPGDLLAVDGPAAEAARPDGREPPDPYPPPPDGAQADAPPHRWGFGAFLLAVAVFVLTSVLVVALFVMADPSLRNDGAQLPAPALLVVIAVPTVLAAMVGIVITRVRGNGPIADLRLRFAWRDVGIGVTCGLAGVVMTIPLSVLWSWWVGEENANSAVGRIFDGMRASPLLAVLVFLTMWLLAPVCEEILYRGLLWGAMERRRWNRWVILAISTVVFAAAHGEPERAPLLLAIGLPMGVARMLSGRLPAAIIAHQINNFLPALGLTLMLLGVPLAEA